MVPTTKGAAIAVFNGVTQTDTARVKIATAAPRGNQSDFGRNAISFTPSFTPNYRTPMRLVLRYWRTGT
jgi:hypothetical protein